MKSLVLALFLACLGFAPAQAQSNFAMPPPAGVTIGGFQVVTACGTGSLLTTQPAFGTIDITGKFCTNAAGGGGGAITIANGADVVAGATTDSPCSVPTSVSPCTLDAIAKAMVNAINTATIPLGPNTIANSAPVVLPLNPGSPTYNVEVAGYTAYATPTDLFCLSGSASKIVRITEFDIRILSTAAALQTIYYIKRSTANTGGASTTPTPTAYDSTNAAPTAVLTVYTSAPSLGNAAGTLRINPISSVTPTSSPANNTLRGFYLSSTEVTGNQFVTLRGTGEQLCINYNGAALTSGFSATYGVEWTESAN